MYYILLPSVTEWKEDSSVRMARRKSDTVLTNIDSLVEAMNLASDAGEQAYLMGELYFSLDYWLKNIRMKRQETKREPAIRALYSFVAKDLAKRYGVGINALPQELETFYGRDIGDHGTRLDRDGQHANYLTRAQAMKYALRWKKGKAYQYPHWRRRGQSTKLVKAESSRLSNVDVNIPQGYGGFVMSISRTIYMARHHIEGQAHENNFHYHSSYLGGESTLCAGTMKIERGVVKAVRTNSGHYRPTDEHMLNVVEFLKMIGAPIAQIDIESHDGNIVSKADAYLANRGNWGALFARGQANLITRQQKVVGEIQRIDQFLVDLWNFAPPQFKTQDDYYGYLMKVYGWSYQKARARAWKACNTVWPSAQPTYAVKKMSPPARPR